MLRFLKRVLKGLKIKDKYTTISIKYKFGRVRRQATNWEKIFPKDTSNKGL